MSDINQLAVNDTYIIDVNHPATGVPFGPRIEVFGIYSEEFLTATRDFYLAGNIGDPFKSSKVLAALTKDWFDMEESGQPLSAAESAEDVYTRYPVIKRQVSAAIRDVRNFFPNA